jgi:RHS repeat-associated core domain protein
MSSIELKKNYSDVGEIDIGYNFVGQIGVSTSKELGKESYIVDKIGYDKDGHTVYTNPGNGTESRYTYDKQRERLQEMTLTSAGSTIMQNKYKYDLVDNILGITNNADPQNIADKNKAKLGGANSHSYTYDDINRLISANGKTKTASY